MRTFQQASERALTAADLLNDKVLPSFEDEGIALMRVLTDRGTEYCGSAERQRGAATLRMKIYTTIEGLHADLDVLMEEYNARRPHQGRRCDGRTP